MVATDPDSALPGQAPERDSELMTRLYREHNQALIRFLMTRLDSEQEAREVAQEAYVRILQLDSHGAVSFLSSYLFKTAAHIAIDRLRHRSTQRLASQDLKQAGQPHVAAPEQILEDRESLALIDRFVQELPPNCRQAFYLHRLHEATRHRTMSPCTTRSSGTSQG
jgi:RNA polymerase sigma-70 factor (ECF subfamily)